MAMTCTKPGLVGSPGLFGIAGLFFLRLMTDMGVHDKFKDRIVSTEPNVYVVSQVQAAVAVHIYQLRHRTVDGIRGKLCFLDEGVGSNHRRRYDDGAFMYDDENKRNTWSRVLLNIQSSVKTSC